MTVARSHIGPPSTEQKIVQYLLEDIRRLPIITNRSQELWLGIQTRAGKRLKQLTPGRKIVQPSQGIPSSSSQPAQRSKGNFIQQHQIRASRDLSWDNSAKRSIKTNKSMPQALELSIKVPASVGIERLDGSKREEESKEAQNLLLRVVVESYIAATDRLVAAATATQWLPYINITEWARELLVARYNVYSLKRSHLRQLLDHMVKEPDQTEIDPILQEVYAVVELQALLPDETLKHFEQAPIEGDLNQGEIYASILSEMDDSAYVSWVKEQSTRAKNQLATGYLRYALRIARNHIDSKLEYPDLVQHAFIGLLKGAERFDYRVNARFGTYTTTWIWQSISRALADESSLVRVPVHVRDKLDKLERVVIARDTGVGDPLSDPDILAEAGFLGEADVHAVQSDDGPNAEEQDKIRKTQRQARRLVLMTRATLSLEDGFEGVIESSDDETNAPLRDRLPAEPPDDHEFLRPAVKRLLEHLTERQREVIELRFGLNDGRERTLVEIGQASGVTRERIRQIEAKALLMFEGMRLKGRFPIRRDVLFSREVWSIPQPQYPVINPVELLSLPAVIDGDEYRWLDRLLGRIPRSSWHAPRAHGSGIAMTRAVQLVEALNILGAPTHYAGIVEQVNELSGPRSPLENATGYNVLVSEERLFVLLGNGVFSLVDWEQARAQEQEPQLPFCPLALPDPPGFEDALFESIFVGHEFLRQEPPAADFLTHMLRWAETDPIIKPWLRQGILSTYYLLGLVPYAFVYGGKNPRLHSTLPHEDVQTLRRYCLEMLTTRLVAMPEFWWLLSSAQLARPVDVADQLAEIHPHGLDDAQQRLYLLNSLGATVRLPSGYYRLTALGEACAAEWARSPDDGSTDVLEISEAIGGLLDWSLW